ncbi:winged helix-turn-helix domain-containing protein [Nitrosopumilus sp.]|uniref:winged helix-turn-helix domain-containing protein n=1 Tax=Nitrosopumilus sp. TaxID=2024843 RepID=UPI003B593D77
MATYRNSTQIVAQLLSATKESGQQGIRTNSLLMNSNLSHNRLTNFMENLTGSGLINKIEYDGKNAFVITEKGKMYLEEYQRFSSIASSFGLDM